MKLGGLLGCPNETYTVGVSTKFKLNFTDSSKPATVSHATRHTLHSALFCSNTAQSASMSKALSRISLQAYLLWWGFTILPPDSQGERLPPIGCLRLFI